MASSGRQPILFNPTTKEPYIPLPPPFSSIRITPARLSDADAIVPILNDPAVYPHLFAVPFPFLKEHAEAWLGEKLKIYEGEQQYFTGDPKAPVVSGKLFESTPMRIIREVLPDGHEMFLGVVDMNRLTFSYESDQTKREALKAENYAKALGDPSIKWMIGDYLKPSHHGKGIMTSVIRTLLHSWAMPYIGARWILTDVFTGNIASRRVFEKVGFKLIRTIEGGVPPDGKREKEVGRWLLEFVAEEV